MLYDTSNTRHAKVFDVEGREELQMVISVDTDRNEVRRYLTREGQAERRSFLMADEVISFEKIHPIFGDSFQPVLFHCYGRIPPQPRLAPDCIHCRGTAGHWAWR